MHFGVHFAWYFFFNFCTVTVRSIKRIFNKYTLTGKYTGLAIDYSVQLLSKYKLALDVLNYYHVLLNGLYSMEFRWKFLFAEITCIIVFDFHIFLPSVVHQQIFFIIVDINSQRTP